MNKFLKHLLIFSYAILALACSHSTVSTGKATLSGKITRSVPSGQTSVIVAFPIPVFNETVEYETRINEDGTFSISVPVFFSTYAQLVVDSKEYTGALLLSPDEETKVEVSLNESEEIQVKIIEGSGLTPEEMAKSNEVFMNGYQSYLKTFSDVEDNLQSETFPEDYRESILKLRKTYLSTIEGMDDLPDNLRRLVSNSLPSGASLLFNYGDRKPDLSYFSFLQTLDLNTPPLNSHIVYPTISKYILEDQVLNIPDIGVQPVENWLKDVKRIIANLVGFDTGLFYDILVFHAFLNQLDDDAIPLSDKQKESIQTYFKNPTFVEYLITENEKITKIKTLPTTINATPQVSKEQVMDAIVAKYKGKVVLVDFWATWCGPCIKAMREIEPIKQEMKDKNVVFVYVTDPSSPMEKFEKRIQGIPGEHYYLTEEENAYLSELFDFDAIPTYLLFDSNGVLKNQSIGFPGTEAMRKMIEELLP